MSVAKSLKPRSVLDGKYALLREIGSGESGKVYEAEHVVLGKLVAVKVMDRALFSDDEQKREFLTEARRAARLAHAHLVDIHDLGSTPDGTPYLVMELLRGETLEQLIAARGALPVAYACELAVQVLAAVAAAHAQGLMHGDLKAANVMVTHPRADRDHVKVLDFGIARNVQQARGRALDVRSDVYSASSLLYAMLAGRDAFEGHGPGAGRHRLLAADLAPLAQVNPLVPKPLTAIVERGLGLDPLRRIDSAEEFIELLQPFSSQAKALSAWGGEPPLSSDPVPRIVPPREVMIQDSHSARPPRESSVVPIRVASYDRGVTDSILVAPRFPRSASTPRLRVGKDFMPAPGEPGWAEVLERRGSTRAPTVAQGGRNVWPAIIATALGFGLGVVIAWLSGAI